jgi:uncharacterized protein YwgA
VEGPGEHLTVREAVLVVLDAAGGTVEGRTAMQKLSYFAGLAIGEDLGHHAHYYGPYSREVERSLNHAALAEDVTETVERFPDWYGRGPDISKYTYELSDQGRDLVRELRQRNPRAASEIDTIVKRLLDLVPDQNQHTLSLAAKTDLILSQQRQPIAVGELPDLARKLGWRMESDEVNRAIEVLSQIGRVQAA